MIFDEYTIPSEFLEFDSSTHNPDSYVNVADLQRERKNHNILLARRCKRTLFAKVFNQDSAVTPLYWNLHQKVGGDAYPVPIMRTLLPVSLYTQEIAVYMRAKRRDITSSGISSVKVYPHLIPYGTDRVVDTDDVMTVSATTETDYNIDIPVPVHGGGQTIVNGQELFYFELYADCPVDYGNSPKITSVAGLLDVIDSTTLKVSAGGSPANTQIAFTNLPQIKPRTVLFVKSLGSSQYQIDLDAPLNIIPDIGEDIEFRDTLGIDFYSISAYEKGITDFFAGTGAST